MSTAAFCRCRDPHAATRCAHCSTRRPRVRRTPKRGHPSPTFGVRAERRRRARKALARKRRRATAEAAFRERLQGAIESGEIEFFDPPMMQERSEASLVRAARRRGMEPR